MTRRATKQRAAILEMLTNTRSHPTADQIYDAVRQQIPTISKGTVYRNLQVLREDEAITGLNVDGTLTRYEEKRSGHYHFQGDKCGRVFDLKEPVNADIDKRVSARTGLKVSSHHMEFRVSVKTADKSEK